ncbi:MAG: hypothetical protein Q8N85_00850 [Candidatus Omnitrophota bacterium]|nr:hypothetical protein [Candidatus Omnitrophota bacterium]
MGEFIKDFLIGRFKRFLDDTFSAVREINKKYAVPQLKTGRAVRFALLCLRLYLILLLGLLFFKFFTSIRN